MFMMQYLKHHSLSDACYDLEKDSKWNTEYVAYTTAYCHWHHLRKPMESLAWMKLDVFQVPLFSLVKCALKEGFAI